MNSEDEKMKSNFDETSEGGWSWLILFASFMIHVFLDGVPYSLGVLITEIIEHFQVSRETVGWMASILVALTFISGPLSAFLCKRYGYRLVTIAGGLISGMSFGASFFYREYWFLFLTAAVISGLGFGLSYLPSIVIVNIYFNKRRALANGLAVCGSGVGTFIFSPVIELLIDTYGWQGTMLIVSGILLNVVACGAVYKPKTNKRSDDLDKSNIKNEDHKKKYLQTEPIDEPNHVFISLKDIKGIVANIENDRYTQSVPNLNKLNNYDHILQKKQPLIIVYPHIPTYSQSRLQSYSERNSFNRQDSIKNHDHISTHSKVEIVPQSVSKRIKNLFSQMFDIEMLQKPIFLIFIISNFFANLGYDSPFLYAKDRALLIGLDTTSASFLISSMGIGNTVGRILFGYLATKKCVKRFFLFYMSLICSGIIIMLSNFAFIFSWMIVYTFSFGVMIGIYTTLTPVVLVDLFGIEKLDSAFGITLIVNGSAIIFGPPFAGWMYDRTNSYNLSFWVCGALLSFGGLMLCLTYCNKDFRNQSLQKLNYK